MADTPSRLRRAREAAGLSEAYVADHCKRHPASIARWERGQTQPSRSCLLALAKLYGVPVADLVDA